MLFLFFGEIQIWKKEEIKLNKEEFNFVFMVKSDWENKEDFRK